MDQESNKYSGGLLDALSAQIMSWEDDFFSSSTLGITPEEARKVIESIFIRYWECEVTGFDIKNHLIAFRKAYEKK